MDYDHRYAAASAPTSPSLTSPTLKQKIRSSICFSCCFSAAADDGAPPAASLIRSSSEWIPAAKERWLGMTARMGRGHQHRRSGSSAFGYDPLSYALNFDEGADEFLADDDDFRRLDFSSRLPPTPPQPAAALGEAQRR